MRVITRRATILAGELCALAHILFYVTSAHLRVFLRTLESNLKRSKLL